MAPDLGWVVESAEKSPAELLDMLPWLGEVVGRDHDDGAVTVLLGCARTDRGGRGREEQGGLGFALGLGEALSTRGPVAARGGEGSTATQLGSVAPWRPEGRRNRGGRRERRWARPFSHWAPDSGFIHSSVFSIFQLPFMFQFYLARNSILKNVPPVPIIVLPLQKVLGI